MSTFIRETMTPINNTSNNTSNNTLHTTPKENPHDYNPIVTSIANSIANSNSSSTLNMPSPPLSPYTRNSCEEIDIPNLLFPRPSKPIVSDLRYLNGGSLANKPLDGLQLQSNPSIDKCTLTSLNNTPILDAQLHNPPPDRSSAEQLGDPIEKETNNKSEKVDETNEVADEKENGNIDNASPLLINPYREINRPGFKKFQFDFLSEYQFKNLNSYSSYTTSSNLKYSSLPSTTRSTPRHHYDSLKSQSNYNSLSDSDVEKPRTRRFVRQNRFELESVDTNADTISRPSTPIRKKSQFSNSSPATPKRQRTSTPISYNYDYKKIEDFCPPLDTLPPNNTKCLRTDWKGQSMDLSSDPLVSELHPAEVVLASILRLPCAVYLDSKRRIFQEKVKRMKLNLPFRRTDAQKSCKIDVNKASRLYASFEKVGWFDEKHFQKFM